MRSGSYVAEGRGDLPSVSDFEERYCGRWDDFREYAEHWATETDMMDRWPDDAVRYFTWDAWTRDMALDHTVVNAPARYLVCGSVVPGSASCRGHDGLPLSSQ